MFPKTGLILVFNKDDTSTLGSSLYDNEGTVALATTKADFNALNAAGSSEAMYWIVSQATSISSPGVGVSLNDLTGDS